ncbi:MAG: hypothetical protein RIT27_345 [Pseudomonadota bacterium]|jgi:uncharacterized integral membrane protein
MLRIIGGLFFGLIFLIGVIFTLYNPQSVQLHYVINTLEIRLAVLLLIMFLAGATLGLIVSIAWIAKLRYLNRTLRKNHQEAADEITRLNARLFHRDTA